MSDQRLTREDLVKLLVGLGFSSKDPNESTATYSKQGAEKTRAVCFVFPDQTNDQKKVSGFAGLGAIVDGHGEERSDCRVEYGITTEKQLYWMVKEKIEPFCGSVWHHYEGSK